MKTLLIIVSFTIATIVSAQTIVLNPVDPLPPCNLVLLGQTLDFERGVDCAADVVLLDMDDNEIFRTSDATFSYTFDQVGQFTFYCNAGAGTIAMAAMCVNTNVVPTMSEWSIICMAMFMVILGVLYIQQKVFVPKLSIA